MWSNFATTAGNGGRRALERHFESASSCYSLEDARWAACIDYKRKIESCSGCSDELHWCGVQASDL